MKSAAYIARLFKGYKVLSHEVQRDKTNIWHIFKLTRYNGDIIARYYIHLIEIEGYTGKEGREQAQAKELVQALHAFPRYEERR